MDTKKSMGSSRPSVGSMGKSRKSRSNMRSVRGSTRRMGTSARRRGNAHNQKKKKKPVIYILGRKADPLPFNQATQTAGGGMGLSLGDVSKWNDDPEEKKKAFTVLGLGELPPGTEYTEEELEEPITVTISETETMDLFFKMSTRVNTSAENADDFNLAKERKQDWEEADRKHVEQFDKYMFKQTQTSNRSLRTKPVQASGMSTALTEVGCMATTFDIHDAYHPQEEPVQKKVASVGTDPMEPSARQDGKGARTDRTQRSRSTGTTRRSMRSSLYKSHIASMAGSMAIQDFSMYSIGSMPKGGGVEAAVEVPMEKIAMANLMQLEGFKNAVETVERAVMNNQFHNKQMEYRGNKGALAELAELLDAKEKKRLDDEAAKMKAELEEGEEKKDEVEDKKVDETTEDQTPNTDPKITPLWSYRFSEAVGKNVSCIAWNTMNPDLMAAGYGSSEFGNEEKGLILFWSLKNPLIPCKVIRTDSSITSMDFSTEDPSVIAVGTYDGGVLIYDIRHPGEAPMLASAHEKGKKAKHSEPVWGLRWMMTGGPGSQLLTSVSTDGAVLLWNLKKGLEPKQIMQLRRIANTAMLQGTSKVDVISRDASTLCVDFFKNEKAENLYVAGTEGGLLHKCSILYSEQTLENYMAHTGPVYGVKCSPFAKNLFLSCSADASIVLWDHKSTSPLLRMKKDQDSVNAVAWSPQDACLFASISRDASLKIWDLSTSTMNPLISHDIVADTPPTDPNADTKDAPEGKGSPRASSPPGSPSPRSVTSDVKEETAPQIPPQLTSVVFAPNAPVVVVGGNDGVIRVLKIDNVPTATGGPEKQEERLKGVLGASSVAAEA